MRAAPTRAKEVEKTCVVCRKWFAGHLSAEYCSLLCHFTRHVIVDDGCWAWAGMTNGPAGYGQIYHGRKNRFFVHRFSYEFHFGPIPDNLQVCHSCDNPGCCRPSHLFLGTQADNIADMDAKGRRKTTVFRGEDSANALLTEVAVREIRKSEDPRRVLALRFNVTPRCIKAVRGRQNWKHVLP